MIWNVFRLQTCNSKNLSHFFVTIQISEFTENYEIKFGRSFRVHILRLVFLVLVIRNQLQSVMLKFGCSVLRTTEISLECRAYLKRRTFWYPEMLRYFHVMSKNDLESPSTLMETDDGGPFLDSITDHSRRHTEKYFTQNNDWSILKRVNDQNNYIIINRD